MALNLKLSKPAKGYLSLRAGMALCAVSNKKPLHRPPNYWSG